MKYYVTSDVHGFLTPLLRAMEEVGWFSDPGPKKLVLCGDALDRGTEAEALIDFLIDCKARDELIYITGNHEDLLFRVLEEIAKGRLYEFTRGWATHHIANGTWDTVLTLAGMTASEAAQDGSALVRGVKNSRYYRELFLSTVDYYETEHYVFCHGFVPVYEERGLGIFRNCVEFAFREDWRSARFAEWASARWLNGMELVCKHGLRIPDKTVVCGHFHTSYGHLHYGEGASHPEAAPDYTPFITEGLIALDAATVLSGRVNCILLED